MKLKPANQKKPTSFRPDDDVYKMMAEAWYDGYNISRLINGSLRKALRKLGYATNDSK